MNGKALAVCAGLLSIPAMNVRSGNLFLWQTLPDTWSAAGISVSWNFLTWFAPVFLLILAALYCTFENERDGFFKKTFSRAARFSGIFAALGTFPMLFSPTANSDIAGAAGFFLIMLFMTTLESEYRLSEEG